MPPLTRERRQELVKFLHKRMEEARVAIRNIRRSGNDDLKDFEKEKMISEDEAKHGEDRNPEADRQIHCRHRRNGQATKKKKSSKSSGGQASMVAVVREKQER